MHFTIFKTTAAMQFLVYFFLLSNIEQKSFAIETIKAANAKDPREYLKINFQDKVSGNLC